MRFVPKKSVEQQDLQAPVEEKKRRFPSGPRVTTLNFEAGYILAVFSKKCRQLSLANRGGSICASIISDSHN
jgi:hypothetical protein